MDMDAHELQSLLDKYLADTLTAAEFAQLWATLEQPEWEASWLQMMDEALESGPAQGLSGAARQERALAAVSAKMEQAPRHRNWLRVAAAVLVIVATGYYLFETRHQPHTIVAHQQPADIKPGRSGAILTLGNGARVVLDSLGNGAVTVQNGTKVLLSNGQLAYDAQQASAVSYNTMTVPRGRQFQLVLPDGSKVWLNSASSIRFPTAFTGSERLVQISGEAYFEVAQDASRPFKVQVNSETEIDVLGTHFNINAYTNEKAMHATLLEGRVQVRAHAEKVILTPGQQARITNSIFVSSNVDTDKVMAWKNGLFNFEGADLNEVMHQLERWYDIEVVYEKGIPDIKFFGAMSHNLQLNDVLAGLQGAGVHFRLDGRRLIVMP